MIEIVFGWRRIPLLLLVFSAIYYWSYAKFGVDPEDEGQLLNNAASVLLGQWPIADFTPSYSPAIYWGLAAFFKLFGTTIFVERIYLIVALLASGQLLYYIATRFLSPRLAAVPTLAFVLAPGPWYKVFFIFALLLAVAGLFIWHHNQSWRTALLAGVLVGLSFAIRWEAAVLTLGLAIGLIVLRLGLAILWRKSKANTLTFAVWWATGAAVPIAALALTYAVADKLASVIEIIKGFYANYTAAYSIFPDDHAWLGFNSRIVFVIAVATCLGVILDSLTKLWNGANLVAEARILLAAAALAGVTYQWGFWWGGRVLQCYALIYVVWTLVAMELVGASPARLRSFVFTAILLVGSAPYIFELRDRFYSGSIMALFEPTVSADIPRLGRVRLFKSRAADMVAIATMSSVYSGSVVPIALADTAAFLTGKTNPTRYHSLGSLPMSDEVERRALDELTYLRPLIIAPRSFWEGDSLKLNSASGIFLFLHERYNPIYIGNTYVLLRFRQR